MQSQEHVREEILQRIQARFSLILRNETLDLDYLLDVAQQELSLATVASYHINIPLELIDSLQELINTLSLPVQSAEEASVTVSDIVTATVDSNHKLIRSFILTLLPTKPLWNRHPIRTEGNLSPEQLWFIGRLQTPIAEPDVEPMEYLFGDHCTDADPEDVVRNPLPPVRPELCCPSGIN
ncbi:hypothetical protein GJAV_G00015570 [Gymnothorax javanicus]|nr:hypothetical protein GJAV_G00015570 [Gymnothorax javanicus]